MSEDRPPTVEEFASRYPPKQPDLPTVFKRRPELWADVVRLRDPDGEFRLTWTAIVEYLALHGIVCSKSSLLAEWQRRR